ncbi:MAG: hypothetical protein IPP77_11060 [Bacteroidetes bacterium]|nr:hypothetical protein [Bacteroidota bacterium]
MPVHRSPRDIKIRGIEKNLDHAISVLNNSVYIGGTGVGASASTTHAFKLTLNTTAGTDIINNNIFVNARSNTSSGANAHYAVEMSGSTNRIAADYNIYSNYNSGLGANGTDAHISLFNGNPVRDRLPLWFISPNVWGADNNSGIGDPNFVNPTAAIPNLHLNNATPAEGKGVVSASVTDDFDGDVRASSTPTDIGADAGNFNTPIVAAHDVYPPRVNYTPLANQPACGGITVPVLTATITDDVSGVPIAGANVPQIWFRRILPAVSSWANNSGTLTSGSGNNGTWDFPLDYSLIAPAITPAAGDRYEYYVVAQDQALNPVNPNIGFNTEYWNNNAVHANNSVLTQTSAMPTPLTFDLTTPLAVSTVYVGTGLGTPQYPTFNGAGGLFEMLNSTTLISDLTVIVQQTSITEPTGPPTILNPISDCGVDRKIYVRPASATTYTVSGNVDGPGMLSLNGVNRFIIDGSFAGSGNYLTFSNTNSTSAVVYYSNNSAYDTVRNATLSTTNTSNTSGIVHIAGAIAAGTGNSYVLLENNNIGGTGYSRNCILASGSAVSPNHDVFIKDNNIFNYGSASYSQAIANTGNSGDNWSVTGNSIYNTGNPRSFGGYIFPTGRCVQSII